MELNIELKGLDRTIKRLRSVPGGARVALVRSILKALRSGRTSAAKAARERYIIPYGWLLKAIGRPRISGLVGYLHVSGTKAPLSMFPLRDIYPYGVAVQELKEGPPINILHAFAHSSQGPVLERETKETRRYPLRTMVGLSAPQMIGQKTQVFPELKKKMEAVMYEELARQIKGILSGDIPIN